MTTNPEYVIAKRFRSPSTAGYQGYTCQIAGVPPGKIYTDLDEALYDAERLTDCNPVGFVVYNRHNFDERWNAQEISMKPIELREHIDALNWSRSILAKELGHASTRAVDRWLAGRYPVPEAIATWLRDLVAAVDAAYQQHQAPRAPTHETDIGA